MMTHWVKMSPIELSWTANNQLNVPFQKLISFLFVSSFANNHFIRAVLVLKTSNSRLNQARNGWTDSTTDTFPDTPLCSSISAPILLLFQPLIHFYLFLHINWRLFNFALVPTSNFPPLPVSCLWVIALDSEHCPTKNFSSLNFKKKSFEGQYDFRAKMLHLKQKNHIELFWRWSAWLLFGFEFYKVLLCWKQWGCKIMHNHIKTHWLLVVLKLCT